MVAVQGIERKEIFFVPPGRRVSLVDGKGEKHERYCVHLCGNFKRDINLLQFVYRRTLEQVALSCCSDGGKSLTYNGVDENYLTDIVRVATAWELDSVGKGIGKIKRKKLSDDIDSDDIICEYKIASVEDGAFDNIFVQGGWKICCCHIDCRWVRISG